MYLKEAFRYQNFLSKMIDTTIVSLSGSQYSMKTVQKHMRSKVNPDAEDETIDLSGDRPMKYTANEMIDLLQYLIGEKEKLSAAISTAKKSCEVDIDAEVSNNRVRRNVVDLLSRMSHLRSSERTTKGYGYKFNAEGNQVQYTYDVKETTTIDFDRDKAKAIAKRMSAEADCASSAIDEVMIGLKVGYEPRFSVNDSFEDILEEFTASNGDNS